MMDKDLEQLQHFGSQLQKESRSLSRKRDDSQSFVLGLSKRIGTIIKKVLLFVGSICHRALDFGAWIADHTHHLFEFLSERSSSFYLFSYFNKRRVKSKQKRTIAYRLIEHRRHYGNISIIIRRRVPQNYDKSCDMIIRDISKLPDDNNQRRSPFLQIPSSIWDFPEN